MHIPIGKGVCIKNIMTGKSGSPARCREKAEIHDASLSTQNSRNKTSRKCWTQQRIQIAAGIESLLVIFEGMPTVQN